MRAMRWGLALGAVTAGFFLAGCTPQDAAPVAEQTAPEVTEAGMQTVALNVKGMH